MSTENTCKALIKANWEGSHGGGRSFIQSQASGIEANPTAILEAMVADGMVRAVVWCSENQQTYVGLGHHCLHASRHVIRYEVVPPEPPHVHEWRVLAACSGFHMTVDLICNTGDCSEKRTVPNRLPLEIPT